MARPRSAAPTCATAARWPWAQAARDVSTQPGALLALDGGQVELAQQWSAAGQVSASGGQALRTASPGCAVVGQAGPVPVGGGPSTPSTPSAPSPLPVPVPVPALAPWALAVLALVALTGRRRSTHST